MFKYILGFVFLFPTLIIAQNRLHIEAKLDTLKRKIHFDAFGMNVERMDYRSLDAKGQMPDAILEDMLEAEDIIYRWPGGATANFYHYFGGRAKGYGLLKEEVDAQEHPMRCDLPANNPNCMSFEEYAPTNYIYNLLDYADRYHKKYNKKKKVVWLPNIFTFYLNNKSEIHQLREFKSFEEVTRAYRNKKISRDFYIRIKDVFDVFDILTNHPTIDLVGIEYGNELYFHQPSTGERYNWVNNALLFYLNEQQYRASLSEHISYYKSIVLFLENSFQKRKSKIPSAAPVAIITNTGAQPNLHLLWNEGIRDSILPLVDGIIHHFYFKRNDGPRIDPRTAEDASNADSLLKIKTLADNFIHTRIPQVDYQYDLFFKLTENGKKMWMTEFNTDNGYFDGYFAEWQNSFFHAYFQFEAFICFIDNVHNTDVMQYAFPHLWVSHINDYNYGAYAAKTEKDGSFRKIKRTTYSTYSILGSLAKKDIKQIDFNVSNTEQLARHDLYTRTYFEKFDDPNSQQIGNLLVVFSNKSGKPLYINPSENIKIIDSTRTLEMQNASIEYLNAPHIYSSNGLTMHDTSNLDVNEIINVIKESDIAIDSDYKIDGYALGYLSIPIHDLNKVVTKTSDRKQTIQFEIYPNPSQQWLNVKSSEIDFYEKSNLIYVVDASGRTINVPFERMNHQRVQMNIQQLPAGNYQLVIENEQRKQSATFIKQ